MKENDMPLILPEFVRPPDGVAVDFDGTLFDSNACSRILENGAIASGVPPLTGEFKKSLTTELANQLGNTGYAVAPRSFHDRHSHENSCRRSVARYLPLSRGII